jgi:peptidyl-tRNA hydrolase
MTTKITTEGIYDVSAKNNVIVFVLDKFDQKNMDKVLEIIEYAACVKFEVKGRTVVVRRD